MPMGGALAKSPMKKRRNGGTGGDAHRLRKGLVARLWCSPITPQRPARFPESKANYRRLFFDSIGPLRKWSALTASALNLRIVP
jgi:hypothetical protein